MNISTLPIKRIANVTLGKMVQATAKPSGGKMANYLRAAHVQPTGRVVDVEEKQMWFSTDELAELALRKGDVVVVEGGAGYGRAAHLRKDLNGWGFQNSIVRIRSCPSRADGRFIAYALQSALSSGAISAACYTATIPHFTADKIGAFEVPSPSLPEQQEIADYLDRETQRIDELIAEQRGLIETLRERRQAAIDAEILPADLADWVEMPLRYSLTYQEGPGIGATDFRDVGVPLLRISSIRGSIATLDGVNYLDPEKVATKWHHFRVEAGDLLINSSASMGSVAEVCEGEVEGAIPYTGIIKIRPGRMTKPFARWYFQSHAFTGSIELLKTGSTIQHFGPMHLRQLRVFLPSAKRQEEIAGGLTHAVAQIDALIAESEDLIALSQERRAALITAAVTGQIDVRTAA